MNPDPLTPREWYCCGRPERHLHRVPAHRRLSGDIALLCFALAVIIAIAAWVGLR